MWVNGSQLGNANITDDGLNLNIGATNVKGVNLGSTGATVNVRGVFQIAQKEINVSNPTAGQVLAYDGVKFGPTYPMQPWVTALDFDFSTLSSQNLGSNTTYSLGGYNWEKLNTANEITAMALIPGSGLFFAPVTNTGLSGSTHTAPILRLSLNQILSNVNFGMPLRLWMWVSIDNIAANFDTIGGGFDCDSATNLWLAQAVRQSNTGGAITVLTTLQSTDTAFKSSMTLDATNRCMVVEMPDGQMGPVRAYVGSMGAAGAWPAFNTLIPTSMTVPSGNYFTPTTANYGILFYAARTNSTTALRCTITKIRVDYINRN